MVCRIALQAVRLDADLPSDLAGDGSITASPVVDAA